MSVVWRQLPTTRDERQEAVRQIAATVLGHIQRPAGAPLLVGPALTSNTLTQTAQTAEPISYFESGERIAGIQWSDVDDGVVRLVTENGNVLEVKTDVRESGPGSVGAMDSDKPKLRRPMKVNRRPGSGGLNRADAADALDPTDGLSEYGEIVWWGVKGGATIGLLEFDPKGTAVIICRLSSEEKNDRLVDQLRPCLALAKQHDLTVRAAIFAAKMSGTREVRPERAAAPPADVLERDDMLELDKFIDAGWVEHVIARGGDRIARDILPGETLLTRWAKKKIGLWLSDFGRRMNYAHDAADRMFVRTMMMISAEERNAVVRRLQTASLNKGPFAGNGHLGPTRFGFVRDKKTRRLKSDAEQWPWILRAFELADSSGCLQDGALSTRAVAAKLGEEGCPFDHDRVRKILKDPIYATGEYATRVRGVPIRQDPVALANPVPIDRFQRVQNLLALRQGASKNTPLGEFLFNYVEVRHKQCEEILTNGRPSLLKGYVLNRQNPDARLYRHALGVPECCQRGGRGHRGTFTWKREWLETPVVEAIRELAAHPELLRQLQQAARHTIADSSARLSSEQRAAIERDIEGLRQRQDQAIDEWIDGATGNTDMASYHALMAKFEHKLQTLSARLTADDKAAQAQAGNELPVREERVNAFLEILSVETPTDPFMLSMRARLFQQIVSTIVVDDSGDGPVTITIEGHLVPDGAPLEAGNPILATEELLDSYLDHKHGRTPRAEQIVEEVRHIETDLSERADKSVCMTAGLALSLATGDAIREAIRQTLADDAWGARRRHAKATGEASWRLSFVIHPS